MRDARIRMLLGKGLSQEERKSALEAAESFKRFDLKVESIDVPHSYIWRDRCREQVFKHVFSDKPIVLSGEMPFYEPIYIVPNDGAILAGVTSQEITRSTGVTKSALTSFSIYSVGAVLTVAGLRPGDLPYRSFGPADEHESAEAIRFALIRELGYSLLGSGPSDMLPPPKNWQRECPSDECMLEKGIDPILLLRKLRTARFCESCSDNIDGMVMQIRYSGCA